MAQGDPLDLVNSLMTAINNGDIEVAVSLYEPSAVLIGQPGQMVRGHAAIRKTLAGFISLKPTLRGHSQQVVEAGDIALFCGRWTLTGTSPDGKKVEMGGVSSDVLRMHPDGSWMIAVDNPWGASIVG